MPTPATSANPPNLGSIPHVPDPLPPDNSNSDAAIPIPTVPIIGIEAENKAIIAAGRNFGRTIDNWRHIGQILTDGVQQNPNINSSHYTERQCCHHAIYDLLVTQAPFIRDIILTHGPTAIVEVASLKAVGNWHEFDPPLSPIDKSFCRFRHLGCGRFNCPVYLDYDDENIQKGLKNKNPVYDVGYKRWLRLLWRDCVFNADDFHCGFLKNELIIAVLLHILIGPSTTVRATEPGSTPSETFRGKRKGNAEKHGVTSVTTAAIAYGVMLLCFALCNQKAFGSGGGKDIFEDGDLSDDENDPYSTAALMRAQTRSQGGDGGVLSNNGEANVSVPPADG
ncbi:hypothetical protein JAAARDRAFT_50661 [Jaapia argillacea MUCL 33604]|uniref:Uncharacterized protein n=1 Tax=Jaapia argillacea MUCL 33604 TaxID=933084 RepID=A0A067PKJ4_9AGAM|nr:hypothetical protein JAAARDRAFT_50661 [Jaapia argillacea MUCL 33604]